jgi:DNA polymerase-3 subunit delta
MQINDFRSRLKSGDFSGWYIFAGEEDYLKRHYLGELKKCILTEDDPFAFFNLLSFDGEDIDFRAVREAIESPPMMSEYKLIEWKYANLDALKESERAELEELFFLKKEYPYAIFAIMALADGFNTGTAKKPSKLAERLSSGFDIITLEKSTEQQLLLWLRRHFDAEGVRADEKTLGALIFRSGRSMQILSEEVSKLSAYAKANGRDCISVSDVETVASPSAESDAFALSNAVLDRNTDGAFAALLDLKQRRVEPSVVVAMLSRTYSELASVALLLEEGRGAQDIETELKMHRFKAKLYINSAKKAGAKRLSVCLAELRRIDALSKSGSYLGYGPIEMFITKNF